MKPQDSKDDTVIIEDTPVNFLSDQEIIRRVIEGGFEPYEHFKLNWQANDLLLLPSFDTLISLTLTRDVISFEHQINAVRKLLGNFRGKGLLCDEVGLGKTVEACLCCLELICRGFVRRVLILVPPSLIEQWKEELLYKFNLDFICSDDKEFNVSDPLSWSKYDRIIASIHLVKRKPYCDFVKNQNFDLIIVDEAHHLRNSSTLAWKFVNELQKKFVILLTATPFQNKLEDVFNLVFLVSPGKLGTLSSFKKRYRIKERTVTPENFSQLKTILSEVMIRNRRATSDVEFTKRFATTIRLILSDQEMNLYDRISDFVRNLYRGNSLFRPLLQTLQMELGSYPLSAVPTLEKIKEKFLSDSEFDSIISQCRNFYITNKFEKMLEIVRGIGEKVIIFTKFRATQRAISDFLRKSGFVFSELHGGLKRKEKEEAIENFQKRAQVLVSTDVGSEGRNLHFCNSIINFDIPWNPMKIEQRIGRISRIGQQKDVYIFNLCSSGTIEDYILYLLDTKINMFELVIGEVDMILGNLQDEKKFEDTIIDMWCEAENKSDFEKKIQTLGDELIKAKNRYFNLKEID